MAKDLVDTVEGMLSTFYKERFIAEYQQLKIRYEKLDDLCKKIEIAELTKEEPPIHDCPLNLLREQRRYMGLYLYALEKRASIEGIDISGVTYELFSDKKD